MALQQQRHEDHNGAQSGNGHSEHMSHEKRLEMLRMHHKQTLWLYWTLPLLGLWLILAPVTFGHLNEDSWVDPSGGRGPWFAAESTQALRALRAWLVTASDLVCGLLLLVFGWRSLTPNRPLSLWVCCFVGIWLTFAPVFFWAPTTASYANDSLVGILVIALTILIPGMPNMTMFMQHGPATPPGWSYNPSSWPQRWVMILLGFLGFVVSRYLAMYQLGYTQYVWDPFFGFESGTRQVLDSQMSHSLPISDAELGTVSMLQHFKQARRRGDRNGSAWAICASRRRPRCHRIRREHGRSDTCRSLLERRLGRGRGHRALALGCTLRVRCKQYCGRRAGRNPVRAPREETGIVR